MLIGSIAEAWVPKCERVLVCEITFKPHPLICMFDVIQLQAKQKRPVAADVQGRVEAALVV